MTRSVCHSNKPITELQGHHMGPATACEMGSLYVLQVLGRKHYSLLTLSWLCTMM